MTLYIALCDCHLSVSSTSVLGATGGEDVESVAVALSKTSLSGINKDIISKIYIFEFV